jgi:hypothetical protein
VGVTFGLWKAGVRHGKWFAPVWVRPHTWREKNNQNSPHFFWPFIGCD